MRERGSTSANNSPSAAADPLIALVRLLASQAAAEFAVHPSVPPDASTVQPEDRE
jgi:hypothetical protein